MLQGVEGAAVEQTDFGEVELPFTFAFRLRPSNTAGLRAESIVRGEGEELRIIQRAIGVAPEDHGLEVVVEADAGHATKMMRRVHMLTQRRQQVHRLDPTQILPA